MNALDVLRDMASRPANQARALPLLSSEQLNAHPGDHPNSIAWLLWHAARQADAQLTDLVGRQQLWGIYRERFNLGELGDTIGLGHTPEEARSIVVNDQDLLLDYLCGTFEAMEVYLDRLTEDDLDDVVDDSWVPPTTRGVRLVSIIDDAAQHVGAAFHIAGILLEQPAGQV